MNNKKLLGLRIKELRKAKSITQETLAESVGVEVGTLSAIESGRNFPSLHVLEKISIALAHPLMEFFNFSHLKVHVINIDEEILGLINAQNLNNKKLIYNLLKDAFKV